MSKNVLLVDREKRISLLEGELINQAFDAEALVGEPCSSITNHETGIKIDEAINKAFNNEISSLEIENDRLPMILSLDFSAYKNNLGEIIGVLINAKDITEQRLDEIIKDHADERFKALFEKAPIGMAVLSMKGRFIQVNQSLCSMTGYNKEELEDQRVNQFLPKNSLQDLHDISKIIRKNKDGTFSKAELQLYTKHKEERWVSLSTTLVRNNKKEPIYILCQIEDITESREFKNKLKLMAEHDALTGLLNRRAFNDALQTHIDNGQRYGVNGALLMIDLDGFKFVNDTLGHKAGDDLLVAIAKSLRKRLRSTDTFARLGGDEFAIILPEVNEHEAWSVAQSLNSIIRECATDIQGNLATKVTGSIGISLFEKNITAEEILANADLAMYESKESGRNRLSFYNHSQNKVPKMKERMEAIEKISSALNEDRLLLYAQPILNLKTNKISFYEILIRMKNQDGTIAYPNEFLPLAEKFDLIYQIDRYVIRTAIEKVECLAKNGIKFPVSINISAISLADDELLEIIEEDLGRCKYLNRKDLIFEVTETSAVSEMTTAKKFNEKIMELGCRVALDDFGSGYGSYYYLKHLPFDIIKIDGEFVKDVINSQTDRSILKSIVSVAQDLNKLTVAEFVENQETINLLTEYGVDFAQGFHIGKPQDLNNVVREAEQEKMKNYFNQFMK